MLDQMCNNNYYVMSIKLWYYCVIKRVLQMVIVLIFPPLLIESITGGEPGKAAHIIISPCLINYVCTFTDAIFHYIKQWGEAVN